jgi:hypothetical protein
MPNGPWCLLPAPCAPDRAEPILAEEASMNEPDQTGLGWTVVLRRQPVRLVAGRAEGGYTDAYELVCCECGDHPDADYREVSPELRQIRGP